MSGIVRQQQENDLSSLLNSDGTAKLTVSSLSNDAVGKPCNPIPAWVKRGDRIEIRYNGEARIVLVQSIFRRKRDGAICLKGLANTDYGQDVRCFDGNKISSFIMLRKGENHA